MTVNRDEGTTPFTVLCKVKAGCKGYMTSGFYRGDQSETPAYEWFRPSLEEAARQGPEMLEHVRLGGLDLRPVEPEQPALSTFKLSVGWDSYMARVVPRGAPSMQIQECRRAFYAGAQQLMGIFDAIATDAVSEGQGVEIIERLHVELRAFVAKVGTVGEGT